MTDPSTVIGGIIAVSGAVLAWSQYRRAQDWRAGDLAARYVKDLTEREDLAFACYVLDWGVGPLIVPTRYRCLLEKAKNGATPADRGEVVEFSAQLLVKALKVRLSFDTEKETAGLIYRYCFDALFGHLAEVHRLLEAGQVSLADLTGFRYWLERVARYGYARNYARAEEVFQPFLRHEPFGYLPVIELGRKLGVDGWET